MDKKQRLLGRLDDIGRCLAESGQALALLGLGSVGSEVERLDDYSDLDFFVIAREGQKARFTDRLDWLEAAFPIAYSFPNTVDGSKTLFEDGIFCEWAVFEVDEVATIPYTGARIVWQDPAFDPAPAQSRWSVPSPRPVDWLIGEAVTNLYVGLGRYRRGERLSAARFIQGYAVDRILELAEHLEAEQPAFRDPFAGERRFEQRFPQTAEKLPYFVQGYDHTVESALAILEFLEAHFTINKAMKAQIMALCREGATSADAQA